MTKLGFDTCQSLVSEFLGDSFFPEILHDALPFAFQLLDSGFHVYFNRWQGGDLCPFQESFSNTGEECSFLQSFAEQLFNLGFDLAREDVRVLTGALRVSLPRSGTVLFAVVIVGLAIGMGIHGLPALPAKQEAVKHITGAVLGTNLHLAEGTGGYVTAVTRLLGHAKPWEEYEPFRKNLHGNPIKILTLQEMLGNLYAKTKTTVASSEVGRLLQVIKASGWKP